MKMIKLKLFELSHFAIDYVFICVEEAGKEKGDREEMILSVMSPYNNKAAPHLMMSKKNLFWLVATPSGLCLSWLSGFSSVMPLLY